MRSRDPYDPRVCFADVLGEEEPVDVIDMMGATLRVLKGRRLAPLPLDVEGVRYDTTEWSFVPPGRPVIGADAGVAQGSFPLFDLIRARFRSAVGEPKLVRVDTESSYEAFRNIRRKPHLEALDARLARLEYLFAQHVSDGHGGYFDVSDVPSDEDYLQELVGTVVDAARGGKRVPLGLPVLRGKVECWLDGDEVVLSVRFPSSIVTTGVPIQPELEDVVGCAERVGCVGLEALVVGAQLAPSTAGRRLLGDVARVKEKLKRERPPRVAVLKPRADAGLAAAMALLQRCQSGDRVACREVMSMAHGEGGGLIEEASDRLARAQEDKARRLRS